MEIESIWWIAFFVLIIPLFFWLRVSAINHRKKGVTARCHACGMDQRLSSLRNFTCKHCGEEHEFFLTEGIPNPAAPTYSCAACGEQNFLGILTCTGCGMSNPEAVPGS